MQLVVDRATLDGALRTVGRALDTRGLVPALSAIYLGARQGALTLRATNLEVSIQTTIPATVSAAGTMLLPGRILMDLIHHLPAGDVRLNQTHQRLSTLIGWGKSAVTLQSIQEGQFPADPGEFALGEVAVPAVPLRRLLTQTSFAISQDDGRPRFTGLSCQLTGDGLTTTAIGGAIVATSTLAVHNSSELSFDVILPGRAVVELSRLLTEPMPCLIKPVSNQIAFEVGGVTLITRLLEGQFPNIQRLLPDAYPSTCHVNRVDLLDGCERCRLIAHDGNLVLTAEPDALVLTAHSASVGQIEERIGARLSGPAFRVPLNAHYLLAGLKAYDQQQIWLEYSAQKSPVRLRGGSVESGFMSVMPLLQFM
jgi:DNA polymerase-3 subunit beta